MEPTAAPEVKEEDNRQPPENESKEPVATTTAVEQMHKEFSRKRKIFITGLPVDCTEEEFRVSLSSYSISNSFTLSSKIRDGSVRLTFPSHSTALAAIKELNGLKISRYRITVHFGHPDSLLFVGNVPSWYTREQLSELFSPLGTILRCFVVHSVATGNSKGYGFVEYATREEAVLAKQKMATKSVCGRNLRVDFADNGMQSCEDLQSKTLFVDRLPKAMKDERRLREMFEEFGVVDFCQIAVNPSGCSRGFAFIDLNSSEAAEKAQTHCNGTLLDGQEIRVSFGMPCRPGACILQPKGTHPLNSALWNGSLVTPTISAGGVTSIVCAQQDSMIVYGPPAASCNGQMSVSSSHVFVPITTVSSVHSHPPKSHLLAQAPPLSLPVAVTQLDAANMRQKENVRPNKETRNRSCFNIKAGHKRVLTDEERDIEPNDLMAVYDKPYIGQHDQGIPFTHPLKRIRTTDPTD